MKKKIIWTLQLMPQVPHWTSASYAHTLHLYVNMFVCLCGCVCVPSHPPGVCVLYETEHLHFPDLVKICWRSRTRLWNFPEHLEHWVCYTTVQIQYVQKQWILSTQLQRENSTPIINIKVILYNSAEMLFFPSACEIIEVEISMELDWNL